MPLRTGILGLGAEAIPRVCATDGCQTSMVYRQTAASSFRIGRCHLLQSLEERRISAHALLCSPRRKFSIRCSQVLSVHAMIHIVVVLPVHFRNPPAPHT